MADSRVRIMNTGTDVLVSNLRGEVGEVVTTWLLIRHFMSEASRIQSDDFQKDIANKDLAILWLLLDKLENDLIARLSELGDKKIGRTNFYFATRKLKVLEQESDSFTNFVVAKKLRQKRNQEIAHREQPERWLDSREINISYHTLVKGTALALRLMKRIDRNVLGPAAPFLWRQARKKRYEMSLDPRVKYMLVPYLHLSAEDRVKIVQAEQREGKVVWSVMEPMVNGKPARLLVCKEWGLLLLGNHRCLPLDDYPIQKLESISFGEDSRVETPT